GASTAATLNNAGNQIGTLVANTASVSLTNNLAAGLVLGTSSVSGNLTVVNKLGNLTQSGVLTVGGTSSFTTSATDATITLTTPANPGTQVAPLNASAATGSVQMNHADGTVLGASSVSGNLTVVGTLGNLTQSGVLTVAGTSSFTTSATDATIT